MKQIFIYKTLVPLEGNDWKKQADYDDISERNAFAAEYDNFINVLEKVPKDYDYDLYYKEVFKKKVKKLYKYFNSPEIKLKDICVSQLSVNPVSISVLKKNRNKIIDKTFRKAEGWYHGEYAEIFFSLIKDRLDSSNACWLDKDMCEEYISTLSERIDVRNKDYNKSYKSMARVIRKDLKRYVKMSNMKYTMYADAVTLKLTS